MDIKYREARKSEIERINELFIEMLKAIYRTDDVDGYEEGYLERFFDNNEDCIFVAEFQEEIVGFLSVQVYRDEGYIYLDDLSVSAKFRDQGIGTKLIEMAETYVREIGIKVIVFHVEKSNARAHELYYRLGYEDNEDQGNRMRMVKEI